MTLALTMALWLVIIAAAALIAQNRAQVHELQMKGANQDFKALFDGLRSLSFRVAALEEPKASEYDHKAFEDIKSKVEALRIAQGLKRG
jgi:predicted Holliday junction resolvase-like endonuclease